MSIREELIPEKNQLIPKILMDAWDEMMLDEILDYMNKESVENIEK